MAGRPRGYLRGSGGDDGHGPKCLGLDTPGPQMSKEESGVTDSSPPTSVSWIQLSLGYAMPGLGRGPFSIGEIPETKLNEGPERTSQLQSPLTSHHTSSHGTFYVTDSDHSRGSGELGRDCGTPGPWIGHHLP